MLDAAKRHFFTKLVDDTFGYYRVYDRLKLQFRSALKGQLTINSSQEFWDKIITDDPSIKDGQIIKLKDFFLTEWVPKLPGQVWTPQGRDNLLSGPDHVDGFFTIANRVYQVLGPEGKRKMVTGGYGSVRVKPVTDANFCCLLNLVKVDDWHCDYGIPVVVSRPVYEQFIRFRQHEGAPWIEAVTGVLYLDTDAPNISKISGSIGSKLDAETVDILSNQPNLRKAFIYVSSPLDIQMRYNGSCPDAIAWTLFKTSLPREPLRLTYAAFNPKHQNSILEAVGFINQYVANFDGESMLTDFDGIQKRLVAASSLTTPQTLQAHHAGTLQLINDWIEDEKDSGDA